MAGIRQHFVPKFLQGGFASHTSGSDEFTWVFRAESDPFNANIKNSGLERQFYTEPGDTLADDLITQAEGSFAGLVNRLKECSAGPVAETELPAFIAHLEVRTRHFREAFLRTGNYLFSRLLDFVSDQDSLMALIEDRLTRDPATLRKVMEELSKRGLPHEISENPEFKKLLPPLMMALAKNRAPQIAAIFHAQTAGFLSKIAGAAKAGHIRALKEAVSPPIRIENYRGLNYRVVDVSAGSLILGDSAVLFLVEATRRFRPFVDKGVVVNAVFLPLTPRRVLVGTRNLNDIDFADIKRQIVRCSLEYFISHENTEENRQLKPQIGADASLLTDEELEKIFVEALQLGND